MMMAMISAGLTLKPLPYVRKPLRTKNSFLTGFHCNWDIYSDIKILVNQAKNSKFLKPHLAKTNTLCALFFYNTTLFWLYL